MNAANSSYFQPMIDAIASMGLGYENPDEWRRLFGHDTPNLHNSGFTARRQHSILLSVSVLRRLTIRLSRKILHPNWVCRVGLTQEEQNAHTLGGSD
ncbi:hypothetical protein SCA6_007562 [Theobroma cacao]